LIVEAAARTPETLVAMEPLVRSDSRWHTGMHTLHLALVPHRCLIHRRLIAASSTAATTTTAAWRNIQLASHKISQIVPSSAQAPP
jgi:hypothetical protein